MKYVKAFFVALLLLIFFVVCKTALAQTTTPYSKMAACTSVPRSATMLRVDSSNPALGTKACQAPLSLLLGNTLLSDLSGSGATPGQFMSFNGTAWAPISPCNSAGVCTLAGPNGTLYSVTGTLVGNAPAPPALTTGTGPYVPTGGQPTAVAANSTLLNFYEGNGAGVIQSVDTWLGRSIDGDSVHTGQAGPESDFTGSVGYVIGSNFPNGFNDINPAGIKNNRLVSMALTYNGGPTLAQAHASPYPLDADWTQNAQTTLNLIPDGDLPNQHIIYVRIGWEQNLCGEQPWASCGKEADFIAAFDRMVTVFRSVDTHNRFRFVWCPNIGGDPLMNSYPGDNYVDVMAMDVYYNTNLAISSPDPDTAFQQVLNYGLTQLASLAVSHNKGLAFGEWGVNVDNFGNYIKDFFDWCRTNNCVYATYWDSNAAYSGDLSSGQYPETGAMMRHLWNPAVYPVEPIAAPPNVAIIPGNGSNSISAGSVTSSTPVTSYYLYKGLVSGGESVTPVATSPSPNFTDIQANGVTAFYRVGAGNSLSSGYLSSEVSAAPSLPSSQPLPSDYLLIASGGGNSTSPVTPARTLLGCGGVNPVGATIMALLAPSSNTGQIAGFTFSIALSLNSDKTIQAYSGDFYGNFYNATSTVAVPFPSDGTTPEWVRADFNKYNATTTFYVAAVNGSTPPGSADWHQLGGVIPNQNHNGLCYNGGSSSGSSGQLDIGTYSFQGKIYDVYFYLTPENTGVSTLYAHPQFDTQTANAATFTDAQSNLWTQTAPATIH